jgi:hypothetical protein
MRHAPAENDSCLFVIIFDGPVDAHPLGSPDTGRTYDPRS